MHIRLKLIHCWDRFLLQLFLTIGTRMFGYVAASGPEDGNQVKAIHFAVNEREFNISVGWRARYSCRAHCFVLTIATESVLTTAFPIGIDSNCHFNPSPEHAQFLVLSTSFGFIQRFCAVVVLYHSMMGRVVCMVSMVNKVFYPYRKNALFLYR